MTRHMKRSLLLLIFLSLLAVSTAAQSKRTPELWRQVEIIRTAYGVPHIRAENLRAAGFALAWLQCEDYGTVTPIELLEASGRRAMVDGYSQIEADFLVLRHRAAMVANYPRLSKQVRDVYEGFAAGVNRYIELHRTEFSPNMPADFTGSDVLMTELIPPPTRKIRQLINRVSPAPTPSAQTIATEGEPTPDPDEGSNAWAFAPSRTKSGKAILLRNPHLQWNAGYYEAHMTVPGVIDFYGDFRIGGPFTVIGGFSRYLGWSTTNNSPDLDEFYELDVDPKLPDHYLFDGRSVALDRKLITATYRNGEGLSTETREYWSTPIGPVIHRANGKIYVVKFAGDGEYRAGEQFLKMMQAKSLKEWQAAMKMRARITSNFTYADREGNIYLIWNASLPLLPHPVGEDISSRPAHKSSDVWSQLVPFEKLPQFLNPPGGYIHNENNSPHFTNVRNGVDLKNAYPNFEEPELSLRAQLGLQLVSVKSEPGAVATGALSDQKLTLEDVIRLKHSYRALLADRVKADLVAAVRTTNPTGDVASAIALIEKWDNTVSPDSRGSTLFEEWWAQYSGFRRADRIPYPNEKRFAKVWSADDPFNTPRGLSDPARAVESFVIAVDETKRRYGGYDVTWGEVHRVRRGNVDVPVGGCGNDLGCFRTLGFARAGDGKLVANAGDGWILAVEFDDTPRALSVLAYGESRRTDSPWFADQAAMFARGEMKKVAFTEKEIESDAVKRYRPGEKAQ
jgi:acyl-homoserine-lactone acylase